MAGSSSLVSNPCWKFLVFISFRGEETRRNFVSHLYNSLEESGISTFRDDERLERGELVKPKLFEAIEGSKLSIVVLSKDYASSIWCLEELSKILECRRLFGQKVLPIFYNVDPSDVRNHKGSFAIAFSNHEEKFKHDMEKVQIWRESLCEVGKISGYDSRGRDESSLIKEIVNTISQEALCTHGVASDFVGMGPIMKKIDELLDLHSADVRMSGIWGMSGIGKTTIAEFAYQRLSSQFQVHYFVSNVKEMCDKEGLRWLQKELLFHLTKRSNICLETVCQGKEAIKKMLFHRKILIVLDDVDDLEQLEALAGDCSWFGQGSRIIITTRNKQLLSQHKVEAIYEIQGLKLDHAFQLFNRYAFKQICPTPELRNLSMQFVEYCKGLPLALKVLGSSMYGKSQLEWQDEIKKLQRIPHGKIQSVLKLSYYGLSDWLQKELFLELACFFNGWDKTLVTEILGAYGLASKADMRVLVDRSLVTIVERNGMEVICMHDLLQEMGKQIIREESMDDPSKRSRLFDYDDIYSLFTRDTDGGKIKGISLQLDRYKGGLKEVHATPNAFARVNNLRFLNLKLGQHEEESLCSPKERDVLFCKDIKFLPSTLKFFHWHGYPLSHLPSNFNPEDLVVLEIFCSPIKRLWKGAKHLGNLIVFNLSYCQNLQRIPNLSGAPKLKKLILKGCSNLVEVHPSVQHLNNLVELNLCGCAKIKVFPTHKFFQSALITLDLSGCSKLKNCPEILAKSKFLTELWLDRTSIKELPSTIENLQTLKLLSLEDCPRLESVSSKICKLKFLTSLYFEGCSRLSAFPEILETMPNVECLDLTYTAIATLPASICKMESLAQLYVSGCSKLTGFPDILEATSPVLVHTKDRLSSSARLEELQSLPESEAYYNNFEGLSGTLSNVESNVKDRGSSGTLNQLPSPWLLNLEELSLCRVNGSTLSAFLRSASPFLHNLVCLYLDACKLTEIPFEIGDLCNLTWLSMCENDFVKLPETIKQLPKLRALLVRWCRRLHSLPKLPPSLRWLFIAGCTSMKEEHIREVIKASDSKQNGPLQIAELMYSGNEIPEWLEGRSPGSSLTVELPPDVVFTPQSAFALSAVVGFELLSKKSPRDEIRFRLKCTCLATVGELPSKVTRTFDMGWFSTKDAMNGSDVVILKYSEAFGTQGIGPFDYSLVTFFFNFWVELRGWSTGAGQCVSLSKCEENLIQKMVKVKGCGVRVLDVCLSAIRRS